MRSMIDWLSEFYSDERNPFLRMSEVERARVALRMTVFMVVVAAMFALWRLLRDWIA